MFKQLNKKGYKHYYEGTVEELDSMDKDNQHLHSEIMQVIMWLYEKHRIWVVVDNLIDNKFYFSHRDTKTNNYASRSGCNEEGYESPTEAYEAAIEYTLNNLI